MCVLVREMKPVKVVSCLQDFAVRRLHCLCGKDDRDKHGSFCSPSPTDAHSRVPLGTFTAITHTVEDSAERAHKKKKRVGVDGPSTRSGLHFLGIHIRKKKRKGVSETEREKNTRVEAELRHCSEVHSEVSRELMQPRVRERKTGGGCPDSFPPQRTP